MSGHAIIEIARVLIKEASDVKNIDIFQTDVTAALVLLLSFIRA